MNGNPHGISTSNTCAVPPDRRCAVYQHKEKRENQTKGIMVLFALCSCGEEVKGQICGGNNGTHESLFAAPPN